MERYGAIDARQQARPGRKLTAPQHLYAPVDLDTAEELMALARQQPWYHTIELRAEFTTTGRVDLRPIAPHLLPSSLDGLRALDIGTFDGFWAFELEARRAAEVVATDLEQFDLGSWPMHTRRRLEDEFVGISPSERFHIARVLRGSKVRHVGCSIYELEPSRIGGPVDYAIIGALLIHLRDPIGGLEATRTVIAPGGRLLIVEPFDVVGTLVRPLRPAAALRAHRTRWDWWLGNLAYLRQALLLAGFRKVRPRWLFRLSGLADRPMPFAALEAQAPVT